jgi:hypothetical protein
MQHEEQYIEPSLTDYTGSGTYFVELRARTQLIKEHAQTSKRTKGYHFGDGGRILSICPFVQIKLAPKSKKISG